VFSPLALLLIGLIFQVPSFSTIIIPGACSAYNTDRVFRRNETPGGSETTTIATVSSPTMIANSSRQHADPPIAPLFAFASTLVKLIISIWSGSDGKNLP
jgi:hypothetical protein